MNRCTRIVLVLAVVAACKGKRDHNERAEDGNSKTAAGSGDLGGDQLHRGERDKRPDDSPPKFKTGKSNDESVENFAKNLPVEAPVGAATDTSATVPGVQHDTDKKLGDKEQMTKHEPESQAPTRAWFPETFLFAPLVVTDERGAATVPVRVPDRLTTWQVLALAHTRNGAQGGAVTSFLGTLPTYVDPVVPGFLIKGDEVRLPIQLVNTTASPVTGAFAIAATNATLVGTGGNRTIPATGSLVEYATLKAERAGNVKLQVALGGADSVVRAIEVQPAGKPMVTTRSGTLAAPRTLSIDAPAGSDPATDQVRLLVFPGALALLRSELAVSTARDGVADDAYALLLAGKATALLGALGDKPDPEAIRTLSIVTAQRAIRDGRTLDVTTASLLAEAALAHPANPVLARLGERAAAYLAQNQRPDGTFAGGAGWTLQRVLIATAEATRAITAANGTIGTRQRAQGARVRAGAAFERYLDTVADGYTAAAILATGSIEGPIVDKLKTRILDSVKVSPDGAKYLDVPDGIVRSDGTIPSRAEATALAVLALASDPKAPLADLGTTLLGSYNPGTGWGDGRANLACMQAVLELFKSPVPAAVKLTLLMDGKPIVGGDFDTARLRDVVALDGPAPGMSGAHTWSVTAEPAVPGLGFSLALRSWVPWDKETTHGGLELSLPKTIDAVVGKPTTVAISAIAPSGVPVHIQLALPAGVQADSPSLQALIDAGTLERFTVADGKVDLFITPLEPGKTFAASYRVIPTLAGKLHSSASLIETDTTAFHVPPSEWSIK